MPIVMAGILPAARTRQPQKAPSPVDGAYTVIHAACRGSIRQRSSGRRPLPMTKERMSTQEPTPNEVDELARKRAERESTAEPELRERVRQETRRTARRMAAAERARRRAGTPLPPPPDGGSGGVSGAA